jgi:D-glycero-D-manno-heptose 1,7-bisphosphate phosphatase
MRRAVFLDRDGTLIEDKDYLHKPEEVIFFPGALEALQSLAEHGFDLVMVTNQSGVGRGYFTMKDVELVHEHIQNVLAERKVTFLKIYTAPEAPDQESRGRKPSPAFLFDARDEFGINLSQSYMVGDKRIDLECGWKAGVKKSILVRTGYGQKVAADNPELSKHAEIFPDLAAAAGWIIQQS